MRSIALFMILLAFYYLDSHAVPNLPGSDAPDIRNISNMSKKSWRSFEQSGITFTNGKYCPNVTFDSPRALDSLRRRCDPHTLISAAPTHHDHVLRLAATGATHVAVVVTQYQRLSPIVYTPTNPTSCAKVS